MEPQLYMDGMQRRALLERHEFYVTQAKKRLLSQFADIESDAENFEEEEWQRALSSPAYDDNVDLSAEAESCREKGFKHYDQLHDLKKQVGLAVLAGMYHQWDKDLRGFIESELRHSLDKDYIKKEVWHSDSDRALKILEQFNWDIKNEPFYQFLATCKHLVNVYKHGDGNSFRYIKDNHPEYFERFNANETSLSKTYLEHNDICITEDQLEVFAQAIRDFWSQIPERLQLSNIK